MTEWRNGMTERKESRLWEPFIGARAGLFLPSAVSQAALPWFTLPCSIHIMTAKKKTLLHFYWPLYPHYLDTVKKESTSIWPKRRTPLKDKTPTIREHSSASCPPSIPGYVHGKPILNPCTSVFIHYHYIKRITVSMIWEEVWIPSFQFNAGKTL